ncbi:AsmA family protein [Vibrio sp. ZSDZ34]|uniref:AsmA family protein n=1 Tax=Vibrio gelatinilyticus TaxID=2893468 RepID=A0A9X1WG65_9VIBR|nr:AsmA family protein [Vibrio gelatinilyticus]MCJ2378890.1 AsmA family protein [Vibrio gelatinilyticus]
MKKISALIAALIALCLLSILLIFATLHTKYAAPLINTFTKQWQPYPFSIREVEYHYPNEITLRDISFETNKLAIQQINQVTLWLSWSKLLRSSKGISDVLINGVSIQQPSSSYPKEITHWNLDSISLKNIDYSDKTVTINDLQLQLENPQWTKGSVIPNGILQASASQVYYQGEAFNHFLIDAKFAQEHSKIYGLSFEWHDAKISTQAQRQADGWSLVNTTINQLHFDVKQLETPIFKSLLSPITHINSLDILNSELSFEAFKAVNLNASFEHFQFPFALWEQNDATMSLDADSIIWNNLPFIEPRISLSLRSNEITLHDADAVFNQGRIQVSGVATPTSLLLDNVLLDGIKYHQDEESITPNIEPYLGYLDSLMSLSINRLKINRGQWIQLQREPFWQISGLNVDISGLNVKQKYLWGMWQGELAVSANSISYGDTIATQALMEASSKKGLWQLERFFVPFSEGYLDAKASIDFVAASKPWSLDLSFDGLPLEPLINNELIGYGITGVTDGHISMSGLAADEKAVRQTVTGTIDTSFRDTHYLLGEQSDHLQAFNVSPLNIIAQRGQLDIQSWTISGEGIDGGGQGQVDLAAQHQESLAFEINVNCSSQTKLTLPSFNLHIATLQCSKSLDGFEQQN